MARHFICESCEHPVKKIDAYGWCPDCVRDMDDAQPLMGFGVRKEWTNEDEAGLEDHEARKRQRIAEQNEY